MASFSPAQLLALVQTLTATVQSLQHQLAWFQRQMFGTKSERLRVLENTQQLGLGEEVLAPPRQTAPVKERVVAAHTRRERQGDAAAVGEAESLPFFDEKRVPVETIEVPHPDLKGLKADQFEVISQKVSYRLAQRPGAYVVLKYVRPVIKRRDTQIISTAPAPEGVIEGSRADVSFLVGLLRDKLDYHLPLYRQHRRLLDSGIEVSRAWLTQLSQQTVGLLEPIYEAHFGSILRSRVKTMDETPVKAGRSQHGKMKTAYFWPHLRRVGRNLLPVLPLARGRKRLSRPGRKASPRGGAVDRWIWRVRQLREAGGSHTRAMLVARQARDIRG